MRDNNKTKVELIGELKELRKQNFQLKADKKRDITQRKLAEAVLREGEERYRSVVEQSFDGITLINNKGIVVEWNKAQERITGLSRKDVLGHPLWDIQLQLTPTDLKTPKMHRQLKAGLLGAMNGEDTSWEHQPQDQNIQCQDGTFRTVQTVSFKVKIGGQVMIGTIIRDITERKKMEEELEKVAQEWFSTFDALNEPISLLDMEGKILRCNGAQAKQLGLSFNEIIDHNVHDLVHGTSERPENCPFIRMKDSQQSETNIFQLGDAWFKCSADPLHDDTGHLIGAIHVMNDITEIKEAEEKIRVQKDFIQTAMDALTQPFYIVDVKTYQLILKNKASLLLSTEKFQTCFALTHGRSSPCDGKSHPCPIKEIKKTGKSFSVEHAHVDRDGERRIYEVHGFPIFDENGKVHQIIEYSLDITLRKQAEENLKKQKEFSEKIIDTSNAIIVGLDKGHKIRLFNKGAEKITGYKSKEVMGGDWFRIFFQPEQSDEMNKVWKDAWGTRVHSYINLIRIKNGDERIISWQTTGMYEGEDEKTHMLISIGEDITERKQAENALRESEKRLKEAQKVGELGDWVFDVETEQITWSEQVYRLFERDPEQGPPAFEENMAYYSPEDSKKLQAQVDRAIRFGEEFDTDYRVKLPNRKAVHHRGIIRTVKDEKGKVKKLFGTVQDITERKRTEDKLRNAEANLKTTFDISPGLICIANAKTGYITECNPAVIRILGISVEEFTSRPYTEFVHPDDRQRTVDEVTKQLKGSPVANFENRYQCKDGSYKWLAWQATAADKDGKVYAVAADITERKKAEEEARNQQKQLLQADKMISLGILVSGVAHEINNPNNSIMLNTRFIDKAFKNIITILDLYYLKNKNFSIAGIKYARFRKKIPLLLSGIHNSSTRIQLIVEDLKRFSSKDSDDMKTAIDLNSVVMSAINLMKIAIKNSTKKFHVSYEKNLPEIKGNSQSLEQVIINLIQNACHALTSGDQGIFVTTKQDTGNHQLVVSIRDEGVGIAEKDLKYITEPFFTTKRESGGTGLGLSVSTRIINEHEGTLDFISTCGEGTTVKVGLPYLPDKIKKKRSSNE